MKGFIYIFNKNKSNHYTTDIENSISSLKSKYHFFSHHHNNHLQTFIYQNENSTTINNDFINSKHIATIGQFTESTDKIRKALSSMNNKLLLEYVGNLRGAFALALADYKNNSMKFFTHIFRIDNIFYRETDNEIVIGTDPLIVSALSNESLKPQIDIDNSVSFLMNGFFADEKTLFKDVQIMPPNSMMSVTSSGISIQDIDNTYGELFTEKPNRDINNNIKENYIEAFKAIPNNDFINIGVTGGKDSRLALLGLLEAGYKVNTVTRGFTDNPDVQMGQLITEKLQLKHRIVEPTISDSKGMRINIERKALQSMIATSGQVYGYENIQYQPNFNGDIGVTGVAALTMKGGYSNLNNVTPKSSYDELIKRFLPMEELLVDGKSQSYKETLKELGKDDFQIAQFKHAMYYRNGRWTSGTRLAKSYSSDIYSPYYDNLFTKNIMRIKKKFLDNGFIQYTLTNKLNREISLLPLVGSRWGFEKDQPVKAENYNGWLKREPLYPKTILANYNWRNLTLPDNTVIRKEFERVLLSNPEHQIFEVVDYNKLKNLFSKRLTNRHLKFMWSLLSLFAYINYLNGMPITSKNINITLPKTTVNKTPSTPKTIDLTGEIHTTNKDVNILPSNGKYIIRREFENNTNKNMYISTFSNNISKPVKIDKSIIAGRKTISFNLHLSSSQNFELRYCVIFFNEIGEKIQANWFKDVLTVKSKNIKGQTNIPDAAFSYKIALKIPNSFKGYINLDYFFVNLK